MSQPHTVSRPAEPALRPPDSRDKPLFTPGPLTTSRTVKQAMLRDVGSRDPEFIGIVRGIRERLVALGGSTPGVHEAVLIQGSGTFAVEAILSTAVPRDGKLMVLVNGAYGRRMARMAEVAGIPCRSLEWPENKAVDPKRVSEELAGDPDVTHVAVVHCETSTGILNRVSRIGRTVHEAGRVFIVDAMSSFGAIPLDLDDAGIDWLASSANKCIEGVPGFAFALARTERLRECEGRARSLSLDLYDQWAGLEKDGQFRFTPPTHALLAFDQALRELEAEGGIAGRAERYRRNYLALTSGMRNLGFIEYLPPQVQGHIITAYLYPENVYFEFGEFYRRLNDKGYVIYPGKVSDADCFRIGNIGRLFESDMRDLVRAVGETLGEMGVEL